MSKDVILILFKGDSIVMNESGFANFGHLEFDQELFNELLQYGSILGDFECSTYEFGSHRVRVFEHDKTHKVYWVHQYNGEVVEFREVCEAI